VEEKKCANPVLGVAVHADKQSLMGYSVDQEPRVFVQVFVAMPTMVPTLKRLLEEDGVEFPAGTLPHGQTHAACPTFESNVPFVLRFLIDREINGSTWLELPQGAYTRRAPKDTVTHTQVKNNWLGGVGWGGSLRPTIKAAS
jgi:DNA polymerase delta subunit 1